jgi:hypothetical protein
MKIEATIHLIQKIIQKKRASSPERMETTREASNAAAYSTHTANRIAIPRLKTRVLLMVITLVSILFTPATGKAQVTQRNLLANQYSAAVLSTALIPKDAWEPYPQTPDAWRAAVPETLVNNIVKGAAELLTYTFKPISATLSLDYVRSGDRNRHSDLSFKKRDVLMQLVVAESMEGKGRFIEAILNGIWSLCEESYWGVPAHIGRTGLPDVENPVVDLFTAETAGVLALADYFMGTRLDTINPLIRKRIYHETNKRLFVPMHQDSKNYKWMSRTTPVNNWNPWIMSNWIISSLLLEKDNQRRSDMVYASMVGLDAYFNSLGDDGGCDEGPSYWFAAGASAFDCLDLLYKATKGTVNIYDHELIKKMGGYINNTHIAGKYFVNFADADPSFVPNGLLLYRFGEAIGDQQMVQMGKWAQQQFPMQNVGGFMRMRQVENLLYVKNIDRQPVQYSAPAYAWIKDVQIMSAKTPKGLFLATHGGHNNESHNHNDVGDFIIYLKGEPMVIDAGRGNYTARTFGSQRYTLWFTQSTHHNLPIVNGVAQKEGLAFKATNVEALNNEKVAALSMDIAKAYPKEAGIHQWKRTVALNKTKERVEIAEEYSLEAAPQALQQVFMTVCEVDSKIPGKVVLRGTAAQLELVYDPSIWTVTTELPSTEGMEYSSFKTKWGGKVITRIVLTRTKPVQKGKHGFQFIPVTP